MVIGSEKKWFMKIEMNGTTFFHGKILKIKKLKVLYDRI